MIKAKTRAHVFNPVRKNLLFGHFKSHIELIESIEMEGVPADLDIMRGSFMLEFEFKKSRYMFFIDAIGLDGNIEGKFETYIKINDLMFKITIQGENKRKCSVWNGESFKSNRLWSPVLDSILVEIVHEEDIEEDLVCFTIHANEMTLCKYNEAEIS